MNVQKKHLGVKWLSYVTSFIVPTLVAFSKFDFSLESLSTPLFFWGDEFFNASLVASFLWGRGLSNSIFGAPLGQDWSFAFVSQDASAHVISALLGSFKDSPYFGINVYMLLTFGLVGISFLFSCNLLKISNTIGLPLSLFVALLPQHFNYSTQSLVLNSYFFVPPLLALTIRKLTVDDQLFFRSIKSKIFLGTFLIITGAFYSYYTLGFLAIVGTFALLLCVYFGALWPFKRLSTIFIPVFSGFLISAIPSLARVNSTSGGVNYFQERSWQAAYANSGSLIQSITPPPGGFMYKFIDFFHPEWNQTFNQLKDQINSYGVFQEGWNGTIPIFLIVTVLFVAYLLGLHRQSSNSQARTNIISTKDVQFYYLLLIGFITLLWMWAGGLGTFFAMFISESLRGYARFSVFAVIALAFALAIGLESIRTIPSLKFSVLKTSTYGMLAILAVEGLFYPTHKQSLEIPSQIADVRAIVKKIPDNCSVLQFPVVHFPFESPGWPGYRLLAPGLVGDNKSIKWSAGLVGGSPDWTYMKKYREFQDSPSNGLINEAKRDGFCAILVDSTVWADFFNFAPVPSYNRVPSLRYTDFLNTIKGGEEIRTSYGDYYLYTIKSSG